ncbi:MAG TPA: pirin family protein [Burkholderiales bacterium]|nr:pirin family protein [Burkholderiales bacterium]
MSTVLATKAAAGNRSAARVIRSHPAQPAPGLDVLRPFPGPQLDYASPFLMLDHFGPDRIRPGDEGGLNPHPHRGFETVTFLFQGSMEHQDSSGGRGILKPGSVQWMTAGSGIVHAEYREKEFARTGGILEGVQLWLNLPRKYKMEKPHYQDLQPEAIPVVQVEGGEVRVVAGEQLGVRGPAVSYTPVTAVRIDLQAGARVTLRAPAGHNAYLYAVSGSGRAGGAAFAATQLVEFRDDGEAVEVEAGEALEALFLAGEPIDEPVVSWGPFVMNTREEILQARDDYLAGRMGRLDERS